MNKIEIDDEVYDFLKKQAEPFRDTPNSVLRRHLLKDPGREPNKPPPNIRPQPEGFIHRFLAQNFAENFSVHPPYRTMFESEKTIFYFQNYDKAGTPNLWFRLHRKALDTLQRSGKSAFVCFANPTERYAYLIPIRHIDDYVPASKWKGQSLEVNIDPVNNRWRGLDWKLDTYFKEVRA